MAELVSNLHGGREVLSRWARLLQSRGLIDLAADEDEGPILQLTPRGRNAIADILDLDGDYHSRS